MSLKILVTGGLGFVGSTIVKALCEKHADAQIVVVDKEQVVNCPGGHRWNDLSMLEKVQYVQADITDEEDIVQALEISRPDAVIHSAGLIPLGQERYSRSTQAQVWRVNVDGTRNMLAAAKRVGTVRAFVYTSSCTAVTDDLGRAGGYPNMDESWPTVRMGCSLIYGESKSEAERSVVEYNGPNFGTCVLRPAIIFGEGDTQFIPIIHSCIARGETPYVVGDGMNLCDTVYVGNVADAHVLAVQNLLDSGSRQAAGEIFFIQNNEPVTFREFCLEVWKNFGHIPKHHVHIPLELGWMAGLLAEAWSLLCRSPVTLSRGSVLDASSVRYASGAKAHKILGYTARVGLQEGLCRSCKVRYPMLFAVLVLATRSLLTLCTKKRQLTRTRNIRLGSRDSRRKRTPQEALLRSKVSLCRRERVW